MSIRPRTTLLERKKIPARKGKVFIIKDRCKGCGFCIEFCPMGVLKASDDFNSKGYHYPILVEEPPNKICVVCGFCNLICPEFAIYTVPVNSDNSGDEK